MLLNATIHLLKSICQSACDFTTLSDKRYLMSTLILTNKHVNIYLSCQAVGTEFRNTEALRRACMLAPDLEVPLFGCFDYIGRRVAVVCPDIGTGQSALRGIRGQTTKSLQFVLEHILCLPPCAVDAVTSPSSLPGTARLVRGALYLTEKEPTAALGHQVVRPEIGRLGDKHQRTADVINIQISKFALELVEEAERGEHFDAQWYAVAGVQTQAHTQAHTQAGTSLACLLSHTQHACSTSTLDTHKYTHVTFTCHARKTPGRLTYRHKTPPPPTHM